MDSGCDPSSNQSDIKIPLAVRPGAYDASTRCPVPTAVAAVSTSSSLTLSEPSSSSSSSSSSQYSLSAASVPESRAQPPPLRAHVEHVSYRSSSDSSGRRSDFSAARCNDGARSSNKSGNTSRGGSNGHKGSSESSSKSNGNVDIRQSSNSSRSNSDTNGQRRRQSRRKQGDSEPLPSLLDPSHLDMTYSTMEVQD